MFGWLRRRVETVAEAEALFDASIDLAAGETSAERVRAAVQSVPGAGWVSVECHGGAGTEVRLFAAGSGFEAEGSAWAAVRAQIDAAIRSVRQVAWAEPAVAATGFAESAAQFAALEQLSALAASHSASPRPTEPSPAGGRGLGEGGVTRAKLRRVAPATLTPALPRQRETAQVQAVAPVEAVVEPAEGDVFRLSRLLALVLPVDGREPAAAAVRRFGSFAAVLAAPEAELRKVPGLGTHCVAAVKLVHAAAIRHARAGIAGRPVLDDPKRLADYLAAVLARERIEQFRILFLDADGMLRADEVQAQGTVNHTPVYPREVVRRALALGASSVILVHNHPTGDPTPSREDLEMTRQVQQAAAVLRIGLRDHVIVGNGRWLSFRDEGLLG